ncbi:MAG: glycosyltransferase family 4 protein [Verrucomicrobiota bacterium]|nr:glycosyltransferase family 4 protein [Verrucomicrobiota bacterium]
MRVAHILRKYDPSQWGGTETAVKQLLDGLRHHGTSSMVFAPSLDSVPSPDPFREAGHLIKRYKAHVPVFGISREQKQQLVSVGGNLLSLDLFWQLRRTRPLDLIHTHTLNRIGGVALSVARQRRLPLVVTIHGGVLDLPASVKANLAAPLKGGWEWGKLFGFLFKSREVLERADAVLTCNRREAELLRQKYPNKKVLVQPHGITLSRYAKDHRAALYNAWPQLNKKRFLLVLGRIDPVKNQGWVVEQFAEILQHEPEVFLVLAGACTDEAYGKSLKKEVRNKGLESRAIFTEGLPPGDARLIGLLQAASMLVVPSLSETFGLVLLEAWAAATPVVSTRTSGALELVQDGSNGFLFDLEKPAEFHAGVAALLSSAGTRERLGRAGHLLASEYDTVTLAGRVQQLYQELTQRNS